MCCVTNWVAQNRWRTATMDGRFIEKLVGDVPLVI